MKNFLLAILSGVACLAWLAIAKSTEPGAAPLTPEVLEALEWFSGLGVPKVKELQPVEVFTGGWAQGPTKEIRPTISLGFLVKDEGERFSFITSVLGEQQLKKLAARADGVSKPVRYEVCPLDEFANRFLDGREDGFYLEQDEPRPGPAAKCFILGWCCWQQGRDDLASRFIGAADALARDREVKPIPGRVPSFRERIEPFIANHLFELELLRFGEPNQSRAELVEGLQKLAAHFPDQPQAKQAEQLVIGLRSLIAEEKEHPYPDGRDLSALTPAERAKILVGRLRDERITYSAEEKYLSRELTKLGDAAVPALIEVLDDYRPTRSVACNHELRYSGPRLDSIGGLAAKILAQIAHKQFKHTWEASPYLPSPAQPSLARQEVGQWWAEYQGKGRREFLIEAVSKGGDDAISLSRPLLDEFPADAGGAILRCYAQLKTPTDRQNLIYGMEKLHHAGWIDLMWKELRSDSNIGLKVAAAHCLRKLGENGTEQVLLGEWQKSLDAPYEGENRDLIEHLASSGEANVIEALLKDLRRRRVQIRIAVLWALGGMYESDPWNGQRKTPPDLQALIEKSLAASLDDDEDQWGTSGVGYHDPCVGDIAGLMLSKALPEKYSFDVGGTWEERETGRLRCLNLWRQSVSLPAIDPPKRDIMAEGEGNRISNVVFADSYLEGSATYESLNALKGQSLQAKDLVKIVVAFGSNLPKDVVGLRIRAVRTAEPHGIVVRVWSSRGPPPQKWQDPSRAMFCEYDGKADGEQAIGGTISHQNIGRMSEWDRFAAAADAALAKPADKELILRIGLWFPTFRSK